MSYFIHELSLRVLRVSVLATSAGELEKFMGEWRQALLKSENEDALDVKQSALPDGGQWLSFNLGKRAGHLFRVLLCAQVVDSETVFLGPALQEEFDASFLLPGLDPSNFFRQKLQADFSSWPCLSWLPEGQDEFLETSFRTWQERNFSSSLFYENQEIEKTWRNALEWVLSFS